ncbi:MAG: type II toxin-antitoxin system RelE/ParE family toxin [Candidatus Kapabacteria bacterium]|jgi:plasmid stabilization system protein ParE|nr:type II toxin-antitoxin system RelE/ParE family toxin [Candidatus Kapabacteria bacterium]
MRIEFLPIAEKELEEAFEFYKALTSDLASTFMVEVSAALSQIEMLPKSGVLVGKAKTRRFLIKNFPFALFYRIDTDIIIILSIGHVRRRPRKWS